MRVLSYIESTTWAMLPSAYDRMHSIATRHSAGFDRALIEAVATQKNNTSALLTPGGTKFDILSDVSIKPESMMARPGTRLSGSRYVSMRDNVAVIDLNGVIAMRMNFFQELCEGGTSTEMLARDFSLCLDSPDVKSIIFLIHSPGGEAFGTHEFARMVFNARGKKPIKAYVSGYGCSAAYFIAAACDEIIIDAQAMVGSIGVVAEWQDATGLYKSLGIDRRVLTSSNAPKKRLDLNKPEDEAEFVSMLDAMENVFINFVAKSRGVTVEKVKNEFGQGGVLIGKDAVKAGMVDKTGSLEGVISELLRKPGKGQVSAEAETEFNANYQENIMKDNKTILERIKAIFADDEEADTLALAATTRKSDTADKSPELMNAEAEIARLKSESVSRQMDGMTVSATAFAEKEIVAGRMLPTEKADFIADFVQAATDDERSPLPNSSRISRLKARQESRPVNLLTKETINASTNKIIFGASAEGGEREITEKAEQQVKAYIQAENPKN